MTKTQLGDGLYVHVEAGMIVVSTKTGHRMDFNPIDVKRLYRWLTKLEAGQNESSHSKA